MIVRNTSLAKVGYSIISPYKDPNVNEANIIPKPIPAISILSIYFHMTYNLKKYVKTDLEVLIALIPFVSHSHPPNLFTSYVREISFHAFFPPSFIPRRLSHRNFEINSVFLIPYVRTIRCVLNKH